MPPRLGQGLLRPLSLCRDPVIVLRSTFSSTTKIQADDLYKGLLNFVDPAKNGRLSQAPNTSRSPSTPSDSSNAVFRNNPSTSSQFKSRVLRPVSQQYPGNTPSDSASALLNTMRRGPPTRNSAQQSIERKQYQESVRAIEAQATRNWRDGDVYSPHDLSPTEMQKARQARMPARSNNLPSANTRKKGGKDVLDDLGVDPLKEYKNFAMMSEFMTEMGRIRHSRDTGLRAVNQRRMAKAVRRAIGIGIMPSVHRHPELMEERQIARRQNPT